MGDKTGIEWTDATWNPVTGCTKVSQGCRNCYALRDWARLSANQNSIYYGRAFTDVRCHEERLGIPLTWQRPRRIFVNSMSDLFHVAVPDQFILRVIETMRLAPQHTFQVLTKRADRMERFLREVCEGVPNNCQMGVSVENQIEWQDRAPLLLRANARHRFVSFEPLLGPIDVDLHELGGIEWAIVGGESGPQARPTHPDWVRALRDSCAQAGVPFFFKQWGEWAPGENNAGPPTKTERTARWVAGEWHFGTLTPKQSGELHREDEPDLYRLGKKQAGRMLDGILHDARPGTTI